jgi:hypothetical protein
MCAPRFKCVLPTCNIITFHWTGISYGHTTEQTGNKCKRKQVPERYVSGYQWIILRFNNSANAINESWELS